MMYALDGVAPETEGSAFWVAPTAVVIGRVTLARDASVWWGAVLRGDNERIVVGVGSNVQENAVLHTDPGYELVIGEGVTVGHLAMLHGCTIEDGALIGMGATILNGVRIGRNCVIGAHALVAENKIIPDNSVVLGVPGRIVGAVTEAQAAMGRLGAAHYVANWKRSKAGLEPVTPAAGRPGT